MYLIIVDNLIIFGSRLFTTIITVVIGYFIVIAIEYFIIEIVVEDFNFISCLGKTIIQIKLDNYQEKNNLNSLEQLIIAITKGEDFTFELEVD